MAEPAPHYLIDDMTLGRTFRWRRTITDADVQATIRLTGDHGGYHVDEAFARKAGFRAIIAPRLLQASMGTKLGGDLNFLAREITFRYLKPVYAGDTLDVEMAVTAIESSKNRIRLEGQITNQAGEVVLTCTATGHLPKLEWGVPDKSRAP